MPIYGTYAASGGECDPERFNRFSVFVHGKPWRQALDFTIGSRHPDGEWPGLLPTRECARPNPPAALWQQRPLLTHANAAFYNPYPWGAAFCPLSAAQLPGAAQRMARPPAPGQPTRPLLRDDPDHVRQVATAFPTALLDGQQPKPSRLSEGVLNHPAADPSSGCKLIDAPITVTVLAHLISNDA